MDERIMRTIIHVLRTVGQPVINTACEIPALNRLDRWMLILNSPLALAIPAIPPLDSAFRCAGLHNRLLSDIPPSRCRA